MTSDTEIYSIAEVDHLILFALRLGFMDDVKHWREVRARLVAGSTQEGTK
jgi:hypothetical protein